MNSIESIREKLGAHGQLHLLRFWDELNQDQREELMGQLQAIDFNWLDELIAQYVQEEPAGQSVGQATGSIEPMEVEPELPDPTDAERLARYQRARKLGEELIGNGKVAAFVVAGGQGSRLGFSGPKGCFPVTPVVGKSLFQLFGEKILATSRRVGRSIPWYIMTSPSNDQPTREFFVQHQHFGLDPADVFFLVQGTLPTLSLQGKLFLSHKHSIARNPDGHGGVFRALAESGALADMARRGVEIISYFQVDNPLVRCLDPLFIGLHHLQGAKMSAKCLPKRSSLERLGNLCYRDGKVIVIEYSEMPSELAEKTDAATGDLVFNAGSIAIHLIERAFIQELTAGGRVRLPLHRAHRKVPHVDEQGHLVEPREPNGIKLEMFVFDALPLAGDQVLVLETDRHEEFSPVKNGSGEDSPESCLADQVDQAARWLEQAGVEVPRDGHGGVEASLEISPLLADNPQELAQGLHSESVKIERGSKRYFA